MVDHVALQKTLDVVVVIIASSSSAVVIKRLRSLNVMLLWCLCGNIILQRKYKNNLST
jgi:hypothetical protein